MKIAIITDTHIGARSGNKVIESAQRRFFESIFFPILYKEGIEVVLHGGDVFDTRMSLDTQSFANAQEYFFDPLEDFNTYAIPGNHDVYYRNRIDTNQLTTFIDPMYKNFTVIEKITTLDFDDKKIMMVPWITNATYEASKETLLSSSADLVLGHFDITGFVMHGSEVSKHGMDPEIFKGFPLVLSGHFHEPSQQGNIRYLGASCQMTWADYQSPRGFHILDTDTMGLEFVKNPYEIFTRVVYNDEKTTFGELVENDPDWVDRFEDRYVKIVVKSCNDKKSYQTFFSEIDKVAYDVRVEDLTEFDVSESELLVEEHKETEDIIREYVASVEGDFDNVVVLDIINSNLMKMKSGESA